MNAAIRCPRCGSPIELPIGLGPRYVHDAGGASYVTATVKAGKTSHVCPTLAAHPRRRGHDHRPRGGGR